MYCIKCGVQLAESEKQCPLCGTVLYHPDLELPAGQPLYPNRMPHSGGAGNKVLCGAGIILFLLPMLICLLVDLQDNGSVNWFGYVAGALLVCYVAFVLPMWFRAPNPVIFVPCGFVAGALYLLYIQLATEGVWFLPFALPITGGLCLITCTVTTLLRYVNGGKLYIFGGALMALGALILLMEFLMGRTFGLPFAGWSVYPLVSLVFLGGLLIYLAINHSAREAIERKLFF